MCPLPTIGIILKDKFSTKFQKQQNLLFYAKPPGKIKTCLMIDQYVALSRVRGKI